MGLRKISKYVEDHKGEHFKNVIALNEKQMLACPDCKQEFQVPNNGLDIDGEYVVCPKCNQENFFKHK